MQKSSSHLLNISWLRKYGDQAFSIIDELLPNEAFFITDSDKKILFWSKGAEELLQFTKEEAVGEHCLKTNRCTQCISNCGVKIHSQIIGVPLELHNQKGELVPVKKYAQALYERDGDFAGTIEFLRPIRKTPKSFEQQQYETLQEMISCSPKMKHLFQQIKMVAKTNVPVLARGESGTGKELLARAIHQESPRAKKPFIAVSCSAIPQNLIEAELFGHQKGAFTGAYQDRKGLFEQADGGSLFLDEIAELPFAIQAKLLRVLETQEFQRVGGERTIKVDVRIITATHKSLRDEVSKGNFRQDLMYRLRVVPLFLPPLRDRPEDIELLLWYFIQRAQRNGAREINMISPAALNLLTKHPWPGNVRELRNVVDYTLAIGWSENIQVSDLPPEFQEIINPESTYGKEVSRPNKSNTLTSELHVLPQYSLQPFYSEKERIQYALHISDGHLGKAAEFLGISRPTLWRKRKKYEL